MRWRRLFLPPRPVNLPTTPATPLTALLVAFETVLVTFEAETGGIAAEYADQGLERVTPSQSVFAAFPVAVVAENAENNGSTEVATAYLEWLYSAEAQQILGEYFYRLTDETVAAEFADSQAAVDLVTVDDVFGGWDAIRADHLADGAILDQVFVNQ